MPASGNACITILDTSLFAGAVFLASACVCAPAGAAEKGQEKVLEEVVVTGTYIKRRSFEGPSPVRVLDRSDLEAEGVPVIADVVKNLTINTGSEFNNDSNTQNQSSGTAQMNLRGLGLGSTLVLVNGRRQTLSATIADDGSTFVDVNSFPMVMIDRIEILEDGAAATYGSDAVAGVVNFITRSDFEGFEIGGSFQSTTEDSQQDYDVNVIYGVAGPRTHVVAGLSYFERSELSARERDFTEGTGISSLGQPGAFIPLGVPVPPFNAIPPGLPIVDPACGTAAGGIPPATAPVGTCGLDFIQFQNLVSDEERLNGFAEMRHGLSDNVELFAELLFARNRVERPQTPSFPILKFPVVPAANPGNVFGVPVVFLGRALGEQFPASISEHDSDTWRAVAGLQGDFGEVWSWNVAYTYSANEFDFTIPDQLADQFTAALGGTGGPSGTEFFNPFGSALIDPALANSQAVLGDITGTARMDGETELTTAEFVLSGDLGRWFSLPGGPVGIAVGSQYRREELDTNWDDNYNRENFLFLDGGPDFQGERNIYAFFGELAIPLLDNLEAQIAVRFEDYESVGDSTDPKFALRWQPLDWLTVRGSYGTAFRAPSLLQSFGSLVNLGEIFDPATGSTVFRGVRTLGNPDLGPEDADTYSAGVTLQPLPDLMLGVGYWRFEVQDIVVRENAQAIVTANPFDPRVIRDPVSGQIRIVEARFINAPSVDTDGLDFSARYDRDTAWGRFSFDGRASWVNEYEIQITDTSPKFDAAGSRNFTNFARSIPEWRATATLGWLRGNHAANVIVRYIDSYEDDQNCLVADAVDPSICRRGENIASHTTVDARYSYVFPNLLGAEDRPTVLTVGAINLFDNDPPFVDTGLGFDTKVHDPRGRLVYMRVKQSF